MGVFADVHGESRLRRETIRNIFTQYGPTLPVKKWCYATYVTNGSAPLTMTLNYITYQLKHPSTIDCGPWTNLSIHGLSTIDPGLIHNPQLALTFSY
jgi:hypothetical protein